VLESTHSTAEARVMPSPLVKGAFIFVCEIHKPCWVEKLSRYSGLQGPTYALHYSGHFVIIFNDQSRRIA
jgi:hypothetical protein